MNHKLTVFIEYKIKSDIIEPYEAHMENVIKELKKDGAITVSWMKAIDQDFLYVESFDVVDEAAYLDFKELRLSGNHPVYGQLDSMINGGLPKLHCWAFQKKGEG